MCCVVLRLAVLKSYCFCTHMTFLATSYGSSIYKGPPVDTPLCSHLGLRYAVLRCSKPCSFSTTFLATSWGSSVASYWMTSIPSGPKRCSTPSSVAASGSTAAPPAAGLSAKRCTESLTCSSTDNAQSAQGTQYSETLCKMPRVINLASYCTCGLVHCCGCRSTKCNMPILLSAARLFAGAACSVNRTMQLPRCCRSHELPRRLRLITSQQTHSRETATG